MHVRSGRRVPHAYASVRTGCGQPRIRRLIVSAPRGAVSASPKAVISVLVLTLRMRTVPSWPAVANHVPWELTARVVAQWFVSVWLRISEGSGKSGGAHLLTRLGWEVGRGMRWVFQWGRGPSRLRSTALRASDGSVGVSRCAARARSRAMVRVAGVRTRSRSRMAALGPTRSRCALIQRRSPASACAASVWSASTSAASGNVCPVLTCRPVAVPGGTSGRTE